MKSVVLVFWASAPPCHHSALSSHASLGWQGHALYRWIDVSGSGKGVTVSYPQGGLFEIGEMVNEEQVNHGYKKWKSVYKDDDTLHVYLMNNYWHTNYKAEVVKKIPNHLQTKQLGIFYSYAKPKVDLRLTTFSRHLPATT